MGTSTGGTSSSGKGGTASTKGGGGSATSASDDTAIELNSGAEALVDVFVAKAGVFVVTTQSVTLFDRSGKILEQQIAPRAITAAAFDDELLVVADAAKLTSYDLDLKQLISSNLLEGCVSSVLLSEHRFVCGPKNDWDRIFYTYDATTGELLASSKKYTYKGIPMRRIPGKDDFVTVSVDSSPSDFHLYSLLATSEAGFVNESPYHGDFRVTGVYAFDGTPPTHLVTDAGLLLHIYGEECDVDHNSFTSGCFTKDGALGTLTGDQVFAGMDGDAAGKLYALVSTSRSFSDPQCSDGCLLQQVDIASRSVDKQVTVHPSFGKLVVLRHDAVGGSIVLGVSNAGKTGAARDTSGYRVLTYPI